jgi:hypothetical protein
MRLMKRCDCLSPYNVMFSLFSFAVDMLRQAEGIWRTQSRVIPFSRGHMTVATETHTSCEELEVFSDSDLMSVPRDCANALLPRKTEAAHVKESATTVLRLSDEEMAEVEAHQPGSNPFLHCLFPSCLFCRTDCIPITDYDANSRPKASVSAFEANICR